MGTIAMGVLKAIIKSPTFNCHNSFLVTLNICILRDMMKEDMVICIQNSLGTTQE